MTSRRSIRVRRSQPGRGLAPTAQSDRTRGRTVRLADLHAENAQGERRGRSHARARRRCRRRRRLRTDPAEIDPRYFSPRLFQSPRLAAAALARRRADPSRHHGRRQRNRRHGDEDGRRPRHRRHRHGGARADRRRRDHWRVTRRTCPPRRRPDAACARRAGKGPVAIDAASHHRRDLRQQDRQRRDARRLDEAVARSPQSLPRAVAVSRRLVRASRRRPRQDFAHNEREWRRTARPRARRQADHRLRYAAPCGSSNCNAPASNRWRRTSFCAACRSCAQTF